MLDGSGIGGTLSDDRALSQQRWLLARIAHRYYVANQTQEEIGREFGFSRPKVQRLLDRARQSGIVDIRIALPTGLNLVLEDELRSTFGLLDAIVAPSHTDPDEQREAVVRAAADYLELRLPPGAVVAVGMGRNTGGIARFYRPTRRLDRTFVSAMGGSPAVAAPTNPNEICRALAESSGGRAESLYAPAYVENPVMRDQLLREVAVAHSLQIAANADVALVGIGGTDDACTMVRSGCCPLEEMATLRAQGAVGDILGNCFDVEGRMISSSFSGRLIGLTFADLRRVDTVIGIVSESDKTANILGALRTGVLDVLIVDETNGTEVLRRGVAGLVHARRFRERRDAATATNSPTSSG
jgi:DNA-binding transcriptional regulator LsrR (DeoR family)